LGFTKFVIKPVIATAIMGICSYFIYLLLSGIIAQKLATIIAILVAIVIYGLAVLVLKIFSKEDLLEIPMGNKIYSVLRKLKIY
jgi:stage V sporulation protein B